MHYFLTENEGSERASEASIKTKQKSEYNKSTQMLLVKKVASAYLYHVCYMFPKYCVVYNGLE